ncbi:Os04g0615550, partial [Oryza sativa Japonica Group]
MQRNLSQLATWINGSLKEKELNSARLDWCCYYLELFFPSHGDDDYGAGAPERVISIFDFELNAEAARLLLSCIYTRPGYRLPLKLFCNWGEKNQIPRPCAQRPLILFLAVFTCVILITLAHGRRYIPRQLNHVY